MGVFSFFSREQYIASIGEGLVAPPHQFSWMTSNHRNKNMTFLNNSLLLILVFYMHSHGFSWKMNQPIGIQIGNKLFFLGSLFDWWEKLRLSDYCLCSEQPKRKVSGSWYILSLELRPDTTREIRSSVMKWLRQSSLARCLGFYWWSQP